MSGRTYAVCGYCHFRRSADAQGASTEGSREYMVAISDFLLTGNVQNLGWLKKDGNPEITVLRVHEDVRNTTVLNSSRASSPNGFGNGQKRIHAKGNTAS